MDDIVQMKLHPESQAVFRYLLEIAPDEVSNLYFPGVTVQPKTLMIIMCPNSEGAWEISVMRVSGPRVVDGVVKPRKYFTDVVFTNPLEDEDADALPTWLREIALHHVGLMNPESLYERQQETARKVAREMFSLDSEDMADDMADAIFTAIRRVG